MWLSAIQCDKRNEQKHQTGWNSFIYTHIGIGVYTSARQIAKSEKRFGVASKMSRQLAKQLQQFLSTFYSVATNKF